MKTIKFNENILKNCLKANIELEVLTLIALLNLDGIQVDYNQPDFLEYDFVSSRYNIEYMIEDYLLYSGTKIQDLNLGVLQGVFLIKLP